MRVRQLNPYSESEITLVAKRMRETLTEVLGEGKGEALYSMDWLLERVRWHLDPDNTNGRVFLTEDKTGNITGHAIARIDKDSPFGYFSTIFVENEARRSGLATKLVEKVEAWFVESGMPEVVYNTADNHTAVIDLFRSHGYDITHSAGGMVQLTKVL